MFCSTDNFEEEVTDPSSQLTLVVGLVPAPHLLPGFEGIGLGAEVPSSREGHTFQAALYPSPVLLGKPGSESAGWLVKSADSEPSPGVSASGLVGVGVPYLTRPLGGGGW